MLPFADPSHSPLVTKNRTTLGDLAGADTKDVLKLADEHGVRFLRLQFTDILGVIKNALPVIHVSPFWQLAISGSVIIIAVAFNARAEAKKGRVILRRAEAAA